MVTTFFEDDREVLDVDDVLPSGAELEFAAEQGMPIHVGNVPPGTVDLAFLDPIATRIADLRVFSLRLRDLGTIAKMTRLRHLLIDEQLDLPPIDLRSHVELQTYRGRLAVAPDVLTLPALLEADVTVTPKQPLRVDNPALRTLHVAYSPRALSLAEISVSTHVGVLGLSGVRDLDLADLPHLPDLERLNISRAGRLHGLALLQRFSRLRTLDLTDVRHFDLEVLRHLDLQVFALRALPRAERNQLEALPNVTLFT